jgi:LacI family transcriptional regulator
MHKVILLIPSAREYERGLLRGIVEYAQIHGPWIFYEDPPAYLSPRGGKQRLLHMRAWNAGGMIVAQTRAHEIKALRVPSVILCGIKRLPDGVCQVRADNEAIGEMAVDHLRGLGLAHFAYCGLAGMQWSVERGDAFQYHAKKLGSVVCVYAPSQRRSGETWYTEESRLGDWLMKLPKPVGLFTCNDDRARMIAEICRTRGIHVPDEIAILGVDNDEHVCTRATPALSSISMATERAGYEAAALLNRLLAGRRAINRVIITRPIQVITRQSTNLIASKDTNLVKAIRFIRDNANHVIQVRDVAEAAGLSRRVLQDRFLKGMGRTVLAAIHQARIQHIQRLLAGSNLSVAAIADALGHESDAHLSRFFTRQTGLTPSAYRRLHHKG